jgi:pimeloyl-ACP methyl ester carboxylesterase
MSRHLQVPTWRHVDVDGAVVHLMEAGPADGEPLLFLHGWGLTPRAYASGVTRLTAAGVRVIAPSLPGFGRSDRPPLRTSLLRGSGLPSYAARVGRLLDVLEVDTPVFVAGHSFGGGVALQLATDRPDLVRGLTLVNSVGGAPSRRAGLTDTSWLRWAAGALTELTPRDAAVAAPAVLRDLLPNLLRRPVTCALAGRLALSAALAGSAAALAEAGLPMLFVWADEDRVIAPGRLAEVAAALPAEVVRGRHGWLLSEPEEFASLLHDALVVTAMLERRGTATRPSSVLPRGVRLDDLLPERRHRAGA